MKVEQKEGKRGSLKWIQRAVNERWASLDDVILADTKGHKLVWRSPLADDHHAEYRDAAFLDLLKLGHLADDLARFWPRRGPQWDALGTVDDRTVILVEAKAYVGEFCTSGTSAGPDSRQRIEECLRKVARDLGVIPDRDWSGSFYQLANRLAHLWFLRENNVDAYLVLVGFLGDEDMEGPHSAEVWKAAYQIATYVLGLPKRHKLSPFILHVYPPVPHE